MQYKAGGSVFLFNYVRLIERGLFYIKMQNSTEFQRREKNT